MKTRIKLLFIILICSLAGNSQVAEYFFSQGTSTYTPLATETVLWSGTFDNEVSSAITIPSFTFNGTAYTSIYVSSNGFITFGEAPLTTTYTPISTTGSYGGVVSGFGVNLMNAGSGTPKISYNTDVNGEIVIQWQDVRRQAVTQDVTINFQIRLNPTYGLINIVYGTASTTYTSTGNAVQVGLRGASTSQYNNRTTTSNWASTTAGTSNSSSCRFNSSVYPSANLTFKWKALYNPTGFTATVNGLDYIDLAWVQNALGHDVLLAYDTVNTFGTPATGSTYTVGSTIPGGGNVIFKGDASGYSHLITYPHKVHYYKLWSFDTIPDYSGGVTADNFICYPVGYIQAFSSSTPTRWTSTMSYSKSHGTAGTYGMYKRLYSSVTTCNAITPLVGTITSNTYLSFHYRFVDQTEFPAFATQLGTGDQMEIQVSVDNGVNFTTIHTIDQNNHTATTEFTNKVIALGAYDGELIKIRFLCTWATGDYNIDIDNVLIENGTNMSYSCATTEQASTANVAIPSINNEIIRLNVITQKSSNPLSVTSITFNTTGSTSATTDLNSARVYYTTTPVFSTATQFGDTVVNPNGTFTITGSQALAQGNNYFWLAYGIKPGATAGNSIDGRCASFITAGPSKTPEEDDPAGVRKLGYLFAGTKSIPGDYATIAAAVTALNGGVIGSGGVTFNVAGTHSESSTSSIVLTATGTADNPIVFQKSGPGANPLVNHTGAGTITTNTLGYRGDAVIIIEGSDYVTFDSIDVAASNSGVEYGYYLRKASTTNGCKNVTVKNANITMTKGTSKVVVGLCAGNSTSSGDNTAITTTGGRHESITFTGNVISNTFTGICLIGHTTFKDQNFVIGASGYGNTIQNFAGNSANTAYGIYLKDNYSSLIRNNTINNMSGGGSGFTAAGTGIHNASDNDVDFTAEYNNINLTSSATAAVLYGIYNSADGELQINHNTIALTNTASSSAVYAFIYNYQIATSTVTDINITNNTFASSTFQTTGNTYLIYNNHPRLQPSVAYVQDNEVSGTINRTGASGTFYAYFNENGTGTGTENISGNDFSNIVLAGTSQFFGINSRTNVNHSQNIYNNTISNITGGATTVYGIYCANAYNLSIYGNDIFNLTGGYLMYGIYLASGSNPGHIYKNEIYNMSSSYTVASETVVNGINISSCTNLYIYNNFISDLKAPSSASHDAIRGISISLGASNSTIGVYYNTIYLNATSTGTNFGTSGIYHYASTDPNAYKLDLRNNIIVNTSTPNGGASTIALRRSLPYAKQNYALTSNNNIFYCGTPASNRLIYWNSTTCQTIEQFRDHIGPNQDSISFSEMPPFINDTLAPYNLRLIDGSLTHCESGALPVTLPITVTDDHDGAARPTTPDIGADEFSGISAYVEAPASFTATVLNSHEIQLDFTTNTNGDDVVIVYNSSGTFTAPAVAPVVGQALANGTVLSIGTTSPVVDDGLTPGDSVYYAAFCYDETIGYYSVWKKAKNKPQVFPVTNFTADMVSQTQIELAWAKNPNDHNVMIATYSSVNMGTPVNGTSYEVGNTLPSNGTIIYKGPASAFSHTGLTQWNQYFYRIWSYDSYTYYSPYTAQNAITDSDPVTVLPYFQDFEGTWDHTPSAPPTWNVIDGDADSRTWKKSSSTPHSPLYCIEGYDEGSASNYLISPPMVLPDTAIKISWWDITTNANLNSYKILLSNTTKELSSFTIELGDFSCTNNTWEQKTVNLPEAYQGQTVYLAFWHYYSQSLSSNFRIDDILIETLIPGSPTAIAPRDGLLTMINPTLWWEPAKSTFPILGYSVYFGTTSDPSTLIYQGTDNKFQLDDLDFNSTYYWKVVPSNINGLAVNVPVWSFTTVTSTQLAESFEEDYFPPVSWREREGLNVSSDYSYHGDQSAKGTTFDDIYWSPFLITPLLDIESGDKLEFFEYAPTTGKTNNFQVYYSDDRDLPLEDWTTLGSASNFTKTGWGHRSIDLTELAGNQYYLAVLAWCTSGFDYVYLDHFTGPDIVPEVPGMAYDPYPENGADYVSVAPMLSWDPDVFRGIPSGYKVYIGLDTNTTTLVYNGADPFFQCDTLLHDTTYYWKVVPYNVLGDAEDCIVWYFTTIPEKAVQIGTEDEVYSHLPISPGDDYSYSQTLYLQSDIDIPDSRIATIYYFRDGSGGPEGMTDVEDGPTCKDWVIYMGHTTKSSFSSDNDWIDAEDMTEVYNGEVDVYNINGWVEITLDIPFEYNNTDNLVIAVDENTPGAAPYNAIYFMGTDIQDFRGIYASDATTSIDPENPPAATSRLLGFPNIRLQLEDIPTGPVFRSIPASKDFGYVLLDSTSNAQKFVIRNNGIDTLTITGVSLTGTNYDEFSLTDTNTYPVDLAATEAISMQVAFTPETEGPKTAYLTATHNLAGSPSEIPLSGNGLDPLVNDFPFKETFEDNSPFRILWTQIQESGSSEWNYFQGSADASFTYAHGGTRNAQFIGDALDDTSKLISPEFDLTGLTDPHLSFWYGHSFYDPDQNELIVYYRTAPEQPWVELFSDDEDRSEWTPQVLALPNPSASYQIAFEGIENGGYANVVDDVTISEPPDPEFNVEPLAKDFGSVLIDNQSSPQIFTITNIGLGTLTVQSVSKSGTDQTQFVLTDTNTYPVALEYNESIFVDVTFSPTTEGGKTASLTVVDDAPGSPHSIPLSGNCIDTTIATFPFTETFENNSPTRPYWAQIQEFGSDLWTYDEGAGDGNILTAHGGTLNARFTDSGNNDTTKLVSPRLDLSGLSSPKLIFWFGQGDWGGDQNELIVYYRTALGQPWIEIMTYDYDVSEWTADTLDLPDPSSTYQLAFEGIDNFGYANVLDDVTVLDDASSATTWIGAVSEDWEDPDNWTNGVPTSSSVVVIDTGGYIPEITISVTVYKITINDGADIIVTGTGSLTVTGN